MPDPIIFTDFLALGQLMLCDDMVDALLLFPRKGVYGLWVDDQQHSHLSYWPDNASFVDAIVDVLKGHPMVSEYHHECQCPCGGKTRVTSIPALLNNARSQDYDIVTV